MKKQLIISISVVASLFLGCGGGATTEEDTNTNTTDNPQEVVTTTSGKAIDGYLYKANVCYKDTSTCVNTDENGEYSIDYKDIPLVVSGDSINTKTTADYTSTLIAKSGYSIITPLTTFLYNSNIDTISRILEIDNLDYYIDKDLLSLSNDTQAQEIYNKSIVIERIVDSMLDNPSDLDKKLSLIDTIVDYCYNKTFSELTQDDFKNIYENFKTKEGESVDDTKAEKLAVIVSQMNTLFSNTDSDIENRLDMINVNDLLSLDIESLSTQMLAFVSSDKAVRVLFNSLDLPSVKAPAYKYFTPDSDDNGIYLTKNQDFNLSNADTYSIKVDNTFLTHPSYYNIAADLRLDFSGSIQKDIEYAKLTIIPKKAGKIGKSRDMLLLIKKPNISINISEDTTDLNLTNTKTISYSNLVFASSDNDNVDVEYDSNYLTIKPILKGNSQITAIEIDGDEVYIHHINIDSTTENIAIDEVVDYLYLVPTPFDTRYKLTNFDISKNENDVEISGDLNLTNDTNISLDNFVLNYDDTYGMYGASSSENDINYAFIFGTLSYEDMTGPVLSFTKEGENPTYWALATKTQICNAYEDNQTMIDLINEANKNQIDCE